MLPVALLIVLMVALHSRPVLGQDDVGSYTVVAGDTLGAIATRFGVSLEELVALNGIQDVNLVNVGQVLLIPGGAETTLNAVNTVQVRALPGESLVALAARHTLEPTVLSALNGLDTSARLYPGQAVRIPSGQTLPEALRFGAIQSVQAPASLVQGAYRPRLRQLGSRDRCDRILEWPADQLRTSDGQVTRQFAFLPTPALLDPAPYEFALTYTTSGGIPVTRSWQIPVVEGPYDSQEIVLPDDKGDLLDPTVVQEELAKLTNVWSQVSPTLQIWDRFARPIAEEYATTSPFGTRRSYNGGPYASYHAGQDFGAPEGALVLAPAAGVVVLAEALAVRGNAVVIDHGLGVFTGYWHQSQLNVAVGQSVAPGDVLGLVGTTGLSTGNHLHWELRIFGVGVDPMQFLEEPFYVAP
ncbi:MAG: peptidoglycan DD-metalloendopeptidase family protein [Caldilineaceae bacterium]|nr:peptidoglycan DD-metalloendopeptidase family protein [Caldilineaceae bacterium]